MAIVNCAYLRERYTRMSRNDRAVGLLVKKEEKVSAFKSVNISFNSAEKLVHLAIRLCCIRAHPLEWERLFFHYFDQFIG